MCRIILVLVELIYYNQKYNLYPTIVNEQPDINQDFNNNYDITDNFFSINFVIKILMTKYFLPTQTKQ